MMSWRERFLRTCHQRPKTVLAGAALTLGLATYLYRSWGRDRVITRKQTTTFSKKANAKEGHGDTSLSTKVLSTGAELLQNFSPINQIHQHYDGIHFYSGEMERQVDSHHFCSHLDDDFHQCVIYDGNGPKSKLIGVEYIISEKLFDSLPEEEKVYWHSHLYEVKSGLLVAPRIPTLAEIPLMQKLVNTYGKTIHTWQIDKHSLPMGPPSLMMSFTADSQVNPVLLAKRDKELGVNTEKKREKREKSIEYPDHPNPKADQWTQGVVVNFQPVVSKKK